MIKIHIVVAHILSKFFCSQDTQYDNPVLDYGPEYGSGSGDGAYDYYASGLATYSPGRLLICKYDVNQYIYVNIYYYHGFTNVSTSNILPPKPVQVQKKKNMIPMTVVEMGVLL